MILSFLPINKKIQVETGINLYQVARENGIDLGGICSGNRTCGKCKALITKGNNKKYEPEELNVLTEEERNAGYRLTCCFWITEETCVIIPKGNDSNPRTTRLIIDKKPIITNKNDKQINNNKNKNYYQIKTNQEISNQEISNQEITNQEITNQEISNQEITNKKITNKIKTNHNIPNQNKINQNYGIAFDIGTTTVVAEIYNLDTKESLGMSSRLNPQSMYGADVISRITYASIEASHLETMAKIIRNCCNELICELANTYTLCKEKIISIVIAANTTMTHLFLRKTVDGLLKVPFQGISYEGEEHKAVEFGIDINPEGKVYVMPGIGGHVGSDTVGCIIAKKMLFSQGNSLMIDIGTNGEIALSHGGNLTVCSAAAGPAFEGASLYQGMRAIDGAITKVKILEDRYIVEFIGSDNPGQNPVGICGSGVIEAAAELYQKGIMDETGRLQGAAGEMNFVTLWEEDNKKVIFTQKDIRELQLAKGAIYAGIKILLLKENISISELDTIYLAGAFGSNVDMEKAIRIGLLPNIAKSKIEYIGNGALKGASMILLNEVSKEEIEDIKKKAKHLELAQCSDFQHEFIEAIAFPKY